MTTDTANTSTRVAIVTGAARGIGRAIAQRQAADGRAVALLDLDREAVTHAADEITAVTGQKVLGLAVDVSDDDAVGAAVTEITDRLGPPTVVVNNAGITRDNLLFKMTTGDWDAVMNVHLRGAFLVTRQTQGHMVDAGWGRIVNLSSTSALGNRGQVNYAAAKAGMQGFTKSLAIELGRFGVTANAVAPGNRHDPRNRRSCRRPLRAVPAVRGGADPGATGRTARGHRCSGRLLHLGRGVVRHRPGPVRGGRTQGMTATTPASATYQRSRR